MKIPELPSVVNSKFSVHTSADWSDKSEIKLVVRSESVSEMSEKEREELAMKLAKVCNRSFFSDPK